MHRGVQTSLNSTGFIDSNDVKSCMHEQYKDRNMYRINREDLYINLPKKHLLIQLNVGVAITQLSYHFTHCW